MRERKSILIKRKMLKTKYVPAILCLLIFFSKLEIVHNLFKLLLRSGSGKCKQGEWKWSESLNYKKNNG